MKKQRRLYHCLFWLILCLFVLGLILSFLYPVLVRGGRENSVYTASDGCERSDAPPAEEGEADLGTEAAVPDAPEHRLDVGFIDQLPLYPNGCESVCAVMALSYLGFSVSVDEFIDRYLDMGDAPYYDTDGQRYGCDPWEAFPGDPRSEDGWGCYAPVIERALNRFLSGSDYAASAFFGKSLEDLKDYIDRGTPVLVWATTDMKRTANGSSWIVPETGETFTWIKYLHCLLLTGYEGDTLFFHDPLRGAYTAYTSAEVLAAYTGMGSQIVVIESKDS